MIGKTIGNLKLVSELGKGGMGVVYLAEHMRLNKKFAVKSLSPELTRDPLFSERFYQEAKNQALLDHPNIVQATDFFEENGQFFLVMEYVEGRELSDLIKQKGKLGEKEALSIIKDTLSGLGFAHRKGMIHRDMKPSNVLVGADGRARIMDFGIAILAGEKRLTSTGSNIGTPWYMSPEQITRPREVDNRSDIYSLGIVLFEMLTGNVPFDGETEFSVQEQQINTPAPDPAGKNREISAEISRMVLKAMEKSPEKRFQSCEEFLNTISAYEKSKDIVAVQPKPKLLVFTFAAIALVCIIAALIFLMKKQPPQANVTSGNPKAEHEAAAALIQNCMNQTSIVCNALKQLPLKHQNLRYAEIILKDDNLKKDYSKQIEDITYNINSGIDKFNDISAKLKGYPKTVITEEFEKYLNNETEQSRINQSRQLYNHYTGNSGKVGRDEFENMFCSK